MHYHEAIRCTECNETNELSAFRHRAGDESLDICPNCGTWESAVSVTNCPECNPHGEYETGECKACNNGWEKS